MQRGGCLRVGTAGVLKPESDFYGFVVGEVTEVQASEEFDLIQEIV